MTDRLAEIAARTQQDERRLAKAIFGHLDIEGARLDINDKRWLIARVRELEARAAADAAAKEVADAALAFDRADKITNGYRKDYGYNRDRKGYLVACGEWVTAKWRLRDALLVYAALAAREVAE